MVASPKSAPAPDSEQSSIGCLARLFWMTGGNLALVFVAIFIAKGPSGFSIHDLAYWGIALLLIAARYLDITLLDGTTADGEAITISHWKRYTLLVLGICAAIWVIVHVVSFQIHA